MKMLKTSLREHLVFSVQVSSFTQQKKLETWAKKSGCSCRLVENLSFQWNHLPVAGGSTWVFQYFDIVFLADKSTDYGKLLLIC